MAVTAELRALFERYAETGDKHGFRLADGRECLGWVVEVSEDAVLLVSAPTPMVHDPRDEWIPMTQIELPSLGYWDSEQRRWLPFIGT